VFQEELCAGFKYQTGFEELRLYSSTHLPGVVWSDMDAASDGFAATLPLLKLVQLGKHDLRLVWRGHQPSTAKVFAFQDGDYVALINGHPRPLPLTHVLPWFSSFGVL
jgi:hypothetical protein